MHILFVSRNSLGHMSPFKESPAVRSLVLSKLHGGAAPSLQTETRGTGKVKVLCLSASDRASSYPLTSGVKKLGQLHLEPLKVPSVHSPSLIFIGGVGWNDEPDRS